MLVSALITGVVLGMLFWAAPAPGERGVAGSMRMPQAAAPMPRSE